MLVFLEPRQGTKENDTTFSCAVPHVRRGNLTDNAGAYNSRPKENARNEENDHAVRLSNFEMERWEAHKWKQCYCTNTRIVYQGASSE